MYYSVSLVNVGCHADARRTGQVVGDDIALKSVESRPMTCGAFAVAATMRRVGAGNQPLHRVRVAPELLRVRRP